jgi:hypothetical protein
MGVGKGRSLARGRGERGGGGRWLVVSAVSLRLLVGFETRETDQTRPMRLNSGDEHAKTLAINRISLFRADSTVKQQEIFW